MISHANKKQSVAILGATGYVGRTLANLLSEHPLFEVVALIGSPASVGRRFGHVWAEKEAKLAAHYGAIWTQKKISPAFAEKPVLGLNSDALRGVDLVFSSVPESAASDEQKILDAGILLISNNPYGRLSNPLIVPELQNTKPTGNLIKMPNCVSIGVSLALAPLLSFEIKALQATTFQSLSGQGDRLYPKEWAIGNVFPIGSDVENTQTYIGDELKTLLNLSFSPQIRSYRAYVQEGHLVDVTVSFQRAVTIQEIEQVWQSWNPLNRQSKPLTVVKKPGHPQSQDSLTGDGMAVYVGNSQRQDAYTLSFTVGVHNIIRGAAGNSVLTAEWLVGFVE